MAVDVFGLKNDSMLGLIVKNIGAIPSEKPQDVFFSGAGNILCTVETEGIGKLSLNFYMI
jgi:hypothetical protein